MPHNLTLADFVFLALVLIGLGSIVTVLVMNAPAAIRGFRRATMWLFNLIEFAFAFVGMVSGDVFLIACAVLVHLWKREHAAALATERMHEAVGEFQKWAEDVLAHQAFATANRRSARMSFDR
jgi:prepilin signal peptidase PulO-like enzyme (type II secretory pathway)